MRAIFLTVIILMSLSFGLANVMAQNQEIQFSDTSAQRIETSEISWRWLLLLNFGFSFFNLDVTAA
jgi:hypothetical protein